MSSSQTTIATKLEGRVAQILNARELIINIGSEQGVRPGTKFAVLAESPIEVRDPTTGEVLDVVDREKVTVEAADIKPRITICRTFRTRTVGGGGHRFLMNPFPVDFFSEPREVVETLRAKDASLPAPLSEEDSYVKINDRVIQITE